MCGNVYFYLELEVNNTLELWTLQNGDFSTQFMFLFILETRMLQNCDCLTCLSIDLKVMNKCGDLIVAKFRLLHVYVIRFEGDEQVWRLDCCKIATASRVYF